MKTVIVLFVILSSIVALQSRAEEMNPALFQARKKQLLDTICQKAMDRQQLEKNLAYEKAGGDPNKLVKEVDEMKVSKIQSMLESNGKELDQLKTYYPQWFQKPFDFNDCPNIYKGIL